MTPFGLVCLLAIFVQAPGKMEQRPSFNGTWKLYSINGAVGAQDLGMEIAYNQKVLVVKQTTTELIVSRAGDGGTTESKYGLNDSNPEKFLWKGNKLEIPRTFKLTSSKPGIDRKGKEQWSISANGDLSIEVSAEGLLACGLIYHKQ